MAFITTELVVNSLGLNRNNSKNYINLTCPICGKKGEKYSQRKLHVSFSENAFNCPKCNQSGRNGLDLYALLVHHKNPNKIDSIEEKRKMRIYYAKEFHKNFKNLCQEYEKNNVQQPVYIEKSIAPLHIRNEVYQAFLDKLELKDIHFKELIKRGLTKTDIISNGYKSVPNNIQRQKICEQLKLEGYNLDSVPGFYLNNKRWDLETYRLSGFFIPVKSIDKKIESLVIRSDMKLADFPRYMNVSSSNKEKGTSTKTFVHLAGFPSKKMILTEGPLKADIIYRFTNIPTIAIPGVNAIKYLKDVLQYLQFCGTTDILIAFDMDMHLNPHVQKAFLNLNKLINDFKFNSKTLSWDIKYGKGFDDYLLYKFLLKDKK